MIVVSIVVALLALVLWLPSISDLVSLARLAFRRGAAPAPPPRAEPPRLLFLVPAHNEELLLPACLVALRRLRYPADRVEVVVIADNCTDRTATIARATGAGCLERHDTTHPGKPHAIAWAIEQLPVREFDAVVIVDADTNVDPAFGHELHALGPLRGRAAQGYFGLSNPEETPLTRMSEVLAAATHRFAYPLKQRAGLNVPLVGNGMVIGTDVLARYGWHAFSICEDWEMYALLTERGVPIAAAPRARIYSQEARSLGQSSTQRQRWTAGRLTVLTRVGPRILRSHAIRLRQKLDAIAELSAPGPALHLGLVLLLGAACALLHPPAMGLLLGALAGSLLRPTVYTIAALTIDAHPAQAVCAFAFLPVYVLWRVATAVRALRAVGNAPWVRTQRHQAGGA
jgi:cellulose synthase/poly-beta-1,6-N-acetylglucosamine synthase-like glycosyltransferase